MSHSKSIIIKCPVCSAKFDAEREAESTFVSCPECDMQVKVSGTEERRRSPRHRVSATIPTRRPQVQAQFGDIGSGAGSVPLDMEGARKRAQEREVKEELFIDDDEETQKKKSKEAADKEPKKKSEKSGLSAIARRAARLEERAAKLEERAAKLATMKEKRRVAREKLEQLEKAEQEKKKDAPTPDGSKESPKDDPKKAEDEKAKSKEEEELPAFEKVEVRSTGERRRLRKAPKAKVPEPRGRPGAPRPIESLQSIAGVTAAEEEVEEVKPSQEFKDRKVSEGAEWRRHQSARVDDPDWESDEEEDEYEEPTYERNNRIFVWSVLGLAGLFAVFASYQFILAEIGWLEPATEVREAPLLEDDPRDDFSRAEMLAAATPVIKKFFSATSNEEALQFVRRAGKVAYLMKKHYAPDNFQRVEYQSLAPSEQCSVVDSGFFVVPVTLKDFSERGIALQIPDGEAVKEWLVDWESWEGYSEMGFTELRIRKPKEPVLVRCYMLQDEYYNFGFSDRDQYLSFKLLDHSRDQQLWAYLEKDSEAYREIVGSLAGSMGVGGGEEVVTLRVQFPEDSGSANDQVLITECVAFGWVAKE